MSWAIRCPDHLGDGIMALPAINALTQLGIQHLIGPNWSQELYPSFQIVSANRYWAQHKKQHQNIILFKPSFGVAWRSRKHKRRVGLTGNRRSWLLTDPITRQGEHRINSYNRIAQHLGAKPIQLPEFAFQESSVKGITTEDVMLIVGTNSPKTVRWNKFKNLAKKLGKRAVIAGGPGDEKAVADIGAESRCLDTNLSINAFAAAAAKAKYVIGTDSGLTHLAAAARHWAEKDPNTLIVLYASTDPKKTGPISSLGLWSKRPQCWPCYSKKCNLNLNCMKLSIEDVIEKMR